MNRGSIFSIPILKILIRMLLPCDLRVSVLGSVYMKTKVKW